MVLNIRISKSQICMFYFAMQVENPIIKILPISLVRHFDQFSQNKMVKTKHKCVAFFQILNLRCQPKTITKTATLKKRWRQKKRTQRKSEWTNEWYYDSNNSDSNLAKRNCKNTQNECCTRLFVCWICQKYTPPQCPTNVCAPTDFIKLEQKRVNWSKNEKKRKKKTPAQTQEEKHTSINRGREWERERKAIVNYKWCLFCIALYSFDINLLGKCFRLMQNIFRRIVLSCRIIFITISMFILWRC